MAQEVTSQNGDATRTASNPSPSQPESMRDAERLEGAVVGRGYRVEKLLGEGGMGAVYLASAPGGGRVALKLIRGPQDDESRRRFVREVRAMQAIENPHVVRVIEAQTDAALGFPYIVMELLEGRDLAAVIRTQGALDPASVARIFVQAARGLAAIHAIGVVHRDIKPSNIFLHETDGRLVAKVCDFGIAKSTASEGTASDLTHTGGIVGSPHYMSPEQVQDSKRVDLRSDLWSLSMAMYEALSGRKGWAGCSTVGELLVAVCTKDLPWLQDEAPWVPGGLASVVHRNLARALDERFASASEMADALEPFASPLEALTSDSLAATESVKSVVAAPAREPRTLSKTRLQQQKRRSNMPVLVGAAVGAIALTAWLGIFQARKAPASVSGRLKVPAAASVWVQGKSKPNVAGHVEIDATPGDALAVTIQLGPSRTEKTVTITRTGQIVPDEIELDTDDAPARPPASASAQGAEPVSPAASAASAASAAAASAAASARPKGKTAAAGASEPRPTAPTAAPTAPPTAAPTAAPTSTIKLQTTW